MRRTGFAIVIVTLLAAAPTAAVAKSKPHVRTASLDVEWAFKGTYHNQVSDTANECGAQLNEQASFDARLEANGIRLKLQSGATAGKKTNAPVSIGTFAQTGSGWPANDCTGSPVPIDCTGTIAADPGGFHPAITAFVAKGKVIFDASADTASLGEESIGGTCTNSDPFAAGGPTGYLGVGDAFDPFLDVQGSTTLTALAKLKGSKVIEIRVAGQSIRSTPYSPTTCNGLADGATVQTCTAAFPFTMEIYVSLHVPPLDLPITLTPKP